jgi:hypothetical protein
MPNVLARRRMHMRLKLIPPKAKKFGLYPKQVQYIRREMGGKARSMINQAARVAAWVRTGKLNIRRGV